MRAIAPILTAVVAMMLPACGGDDGGQEPDVPPARPVEASGCSPIAYGGTGRPDLLIAASSVLQGQFIDHGVQISQALKLVLAERDWRAGDYSVGLQLCDETTAASSDDSDPEKCRRNAHAFSRNRSVIVVAGPWSSTCALEMLPILNRASGGPLAAISGSTTYLGLTRPGPGVGQGEPARYLPTGERGFVRVVPADDVQGAAGALFAKRQGARRVFVLNDDQPYGFGIAESFRVTAERSGLSVAGTEAWDPHAQSYRALADRVRAAGADAVYLAGYVSNNGVRLIEDLRAALGSDVLIVGPDGFATPGLIVEGAGPAAEDFRWTIPTLPNEALPATGRELAAEFEERYSSAPCCFAVQAAQTASLIMDAIEGSDGSRSQVTENLLGARVEEGYLGDFEIDRYGDTTLTAIGVYRIEEGRLRFETAIAPPAELLARR
ncbi:MAG: branched-chain amino acid ABC transporter substrate-binding protein [Thermoleophilaceae bacterium]